jgi:hypothetical protein
MFAEADALPDIDPPAVEPVAEPLVLLLEFDRVPVTSTRFPTRLLSSEELPVSR